MGTAWYCRTAQPDKINGIERERRSFRIVYTNLLRTSEDQQRALPSLEGSTRTNEPKEKTDRSFRTGCREKSLMGSRCEVPEGKDSAESERRKMNSAG